MDVAWSKWPCRVWHRHDILRGKKIIIARAGQERGSPEALLCFSFRFNCKMVHPKMVTTRNVPVVSDSVGLNLNFSLD
jgi:hypothetical protein